MKNTHWNGYDSGRRRHIAPCTVQCARLFKNEQLIKFIFQFFTSGSKIYVRFQDENGREWVERRVRTRCIGITWYLLCRLWVCLCCYFCSYSVSQRKKNRERERKIAICDSVCVCVHRMCNNAPSTNDILLLRLCIFNGLSSTTTCNYAIPIHIFASLSPRSPSLLSWHSFVLPDEKRTGERIVAQNAFECSTQWQTTEWQKKTNKQIRNRCVVFFATLTLFTDSLLSRLLWNTMTIVLHTVTFLYVIS